MRRSHGCGGHLPGAVHTQWWGGPSRCWWPAAVLRVEGRHTYWGWRNQVISEARCTRCKHGCGQWRRLSHDSQRLVSIATCHFDVTNVDGLLELLLTAATCVTCWVTRMKRHWSTGPERSFTTTGQHVIATTTTTIDTGNAMCTVRWD